MTKRILVIDDEASVRKSFLLALEETDYHVDTAESGEKGLALQKAVPYDLIFLDLRMPGMNGVQTLRALKSLNPDVTVYIVTAFHKEFLKGLEEAAAEGISFDLAKKPMDMVQIRTIAKGILEGGADY